MACWTGGICVFGLLLYIAFSSLDLGSNFLQSGDAANDLRAYWRLWILKPRQLTFYEQMVL
jgi:hypothetical protein